MRGHRCFSNYALKSEQDLLRFEDTIGESKLLPTKGMNLLSSHDGVYLSVCEIF